MILNGVELDLSTPRVMTIINVTPDSFYAHSRTTDSQTITQRIVEAVEQGADMFDIGGYSSRPGAGDVSMEQEWERVNMALEAVRREAPQMAVSIDTFRAGVARRAVDEYGECIINDISSGGMDSQMLATVAKLGVPYVAMHMRGTPQTMQSLTDYNNVVRDVHYWFIRRVGELKESGIEEIIIDPGFGFAKTLEQNHRLLAGIDSLQELGLPILAGVSRKSMIYKVLDTEPSKSLAGTIALNWQALLGGASILRVHDTREARQVVDLFNFYMKSQEEK